MTDGGIHDRHNISALIKKKQLVSLIIINPIKGGFLQPGISCKICQIIAQIGICGVLKRAGNLVHFMMSLIYKELTLINSKSPSTGRVNNQQWKAFLNELL